jgi:hypothetical protein
MRPPLHVKLPHKQHLQLVQWSVGESAIFKCRLQSVEGAGPLGSGTAGAGFIKMMTAKIRHDCMWTQPKRRQKRQTRMPQCSTDGLVQKELDLWLAARWVREFNR